MIVVNPATDVNRMILVSYKNDKCHVLASLFKLTLKSGK